MPWECTNRKPLITKNRKQLILICQKQKQKGMTIQMKALDEYILMVLFLIFTKESSFLHFHTFINFGGTIAVKKLSVVWQVSIPFPTVIDQHWREQWTEGNMDIVFSAVFTMFFYVSLNPSIRRERNVGGLEQNIPSFVQRVVYFRKYVHHWHFIWIPARST